MKIAQARTGRWKSLRWWKAGLDSRPLIAAFAVLVVVINALVVMEHARRQKHVILQSAALGNVREATVFEQYASRTIGLADTATRFLAREFKRSGASIDLAQMFTDGTIDPALFGAAAIIALDGTVIASSEAHADAARFELLRPDGFAAPSAADGGLQVGKPIPASGGRGQMIPFFRRLDLPDGESAGLVVLEMPPAHFIDFDAKAARRSNEVIALIGLDRVVRARRAGQLFTSGENVADAAQFQPGVSLTGDFVATSPIDRIRRLFHVREVAGYPLIVVAGVAEADALAELSARMKAYYVRALVLTVVILVLAVSVIGALTRGKRAFAQLRASEATLRDRERELRTLTESMPQLVWMTDAEGSHTYFNQQWIDYTGLSLAQSIGDGWKAAFERGEQKEAVQRWAEAVEKAEVYETEYRLRRADGVYRWMLARALPLRDASGRVTKWFGTSTDIESQVVARAQLREAQQVAHVGSWSRDQNGVHTWSEELYAIFGVSPEEFVPSYDSIAQYIHPDDRPQYLRDRGLSIATMVSFERNGRIIRSNGEVRSVQHRVAVETDPGGVGRRVHGTIQDVTAARAAEEKLHEQANLLNLTRDAFVVRDADDTIRFWNRGAEKIYGWTSAEVVGRRALDFGYVDREKYINANRVLAERGEWSGELQHFCKDGHVVTMSSRWSAMPNERNKANSVLVINTDLTEQKKLEQQLLRSQRLESIGTLAGGVAHDLNNILAPILMAAPLLRDEMPAPKREKLVRLFEECAQRGASIVQQVLTFARGADGERVLLQPVYALKDIAQIVSETFPKTITVETSYPEDLCLIEADPTQLHQILLNLCLNARDAMPDGGTLSLAAENFEVDEQYASMTPGTEAGAYLLISVTDTGTGIRPDILDKIFDPFFTTKAIGSGSGLGLSTVLGLVKDYGGTINAESHGRGTTLRILLPAAGAAFSASEPARGEDLPRGHGETILVVDDEQAIRTVAETLLRKYGYEVLLADDGPAALALFAQHFSEIALVLTDLAMPIMSGISLARTLRKMQPNALIVISAGRDDDCTPAESEELGVAATLSKPYTQAALLRLLAQLLPINQNTL